MKKAFHKKLPKMSVEEQRALTVKEVPDDRASYTMGVGAETIQEVIYGFSVRPGPHQVYIGADARVLGNNLAEVAAALKGLRAVGATVHDLKNNESETEDLLLRARSAFQWNGNRRQQKSKGARGGKGKGREAAARRSEKVDDDIALRLCKLKKITWAEKAWVLGMPESTIIRHYR